MKKLMIPLFFALAALALAFSSSVSAAEGKTMTPQQEKFATCAHESKGKKGEEHKKFMSDCLKGKTHGMKGEEAAAGAAATAKSKAESTEHKAKSKAHEATEKAKHSTSAEREKMKTCEADAKSKKLKGKARKESIGECMKGGA